MTMRPTTTRRQRPWWVIAAGGGLAIGTALAGPASAADVTAFGTQATKPMGVTAAARSTVDNPVPTRSYAGPSVLVDPDNPKVIIETSIEERSRVAYVMRSTNGGATWGTLPSLPALSAYPFSFATSGGITQAPMAWGRNHTFYVGLLGYNAQEAGRVGDLSIQLARSSDLGNSITTTLVDNTRGRTGNDVASDSAIASIAVDAKTGSKDIVYVGFRQGHPNVLPAVPNSLMLGVSTDGGQTFAPPVDLAKFVTQKVTDAAGTSFTSTLNTPVLTVNQQTGALYVVSTLGAPPAAKTPAPAQPFMLFTSTDHGQTFTSKTFTPADFSMRGPVAGWSPVGGPQGSLLVTYYAKFGQTQGSTDVFVERSTDGGNTFGPPVRLNDDDPARLTNHYLQNISVAPNGRVDIAWFDGRNSNAFSNDVYYTYSTDGGATWAPNVRGSDKPVDLNIGVSTNFDVRQPPGVASANQLTAMGWYDTRLGNAQTQTQDVFSSVAQYAPINTPASSTGLRYLAAVFGGLAVAGLIILLVALTRRRSEDEPPTPSGARQRQAVRAS